MTITYMVRCVDNDEIVPTVFVGPFDDDSSAEHWARAIERGSNDRTECYVEQLFTPGAGVTAQIIADVMRTNLDRED